MKEKLLHLSQQLQGEFYANQLVKSLYATDASVYRELPLAVALPKTVKDIQLLIQFCVENNTSLIPRAAGTSLAGQCVGDGIVVDISKYFTKIIQLKEEEKTVRLQPGVIRDDLNRYLKPYNLFFGPNISNCKSVKYIANYFSKPMGLKIGVAKSNLKDFKPETSYLRLSNHKSKKLLKWYPKWSLNKSLSKIIEWNNYAKLKGYKRICEEQIQNYLN